MWGNFKQILHITRVYISENSVLDHVIYSETRLCQPIDSKSKYLLLNSGFDTLHLTLLVEFLVFFLFFFNTYKRFRKTRFFVLRKMRFLVLTLVFAYEDLRHALICHKSLKLIADRNHTWHEGLLNSYSMRSTRLAAFLF